MANNLRIVWAIATKDIVDALKNKTTLSLLVTVFAMIAVYRFLPALTGDDMPNVLVYDAGDSALVDVLASSLLLDLREYDSKQAMLYALASEGDELELGLVIPPGEPQTLEGYVVHSVDGTEALRERVEDELEGQARITLKVIYPNEESSIAVMTSISFLFVITLIGVALVPHLMVEEKHAQTLDVLLSSPASAGQVVLGKALVGLFYCLVGAAAVFAFNASRIAAWGPALLATVLGSLFAVALGLLVGSVIESQAQLQLWAWVLLVPLMLPIFLVLLEGLLPSPLIAVMKWIPTVALAKSYRAACAGLDQIGPELALVAGSTVLVLAAVVWVVRRSDR